jgi:hypothetical protein
MIKLVIVAAMLGLWLVYVKTTVSRGFKNGIWDHPFAVRFWWFWLGFTISFVLWGIL